jgi:hypothetical protein
MELSGDATLLIFVGIAFIVVVLAWIFFSEAQSKAMLRDVGDRMDPELWRELGAPRTMKEAVADPDKRWIRFVRSGRYRDQCGAEVIAIIDGFRRRMNIMMIVIGVAACVILYRFWPLLGPALLGGGN